jgi:hypothetical protein
MVAPTGFCPRTNVQLLVMGAVGENTPNEFPQWKFFAVLLSRRMVAGFSGSLLGAGGAASDLEF